VVLGAGDLMLLAPKGGERFAGHVRFSRCSTADAVWLVHNGKACDSCQPQQGT
jgi:hypothetical protein